MAGIRRTAGQRAGALLLLGLGLTLPARADTIWLNAKGATNQRQIETDLAPAKCYVQPPSPNRPAPAAGQQPPPPQLFLRGRVLGAQIQGGGAPTLIHFEAWWRDPAQPIPPGQSGPPGRWSAQAMDIPWDWILRIEHEADGDVDFRVLLSSRDQLKGETSPSAPVGSMLWQRRMRPALDPGNRMHLVDRPPVPDAPVPPEQVEVLGWVLSYLGGQTVVPTNAEELAAYQAQLQADLQAMAKDGVDPFSPLLLTGTPDDAVRELVAGIARSARYGWLRKQQNWSFDANRPVPVREEFHRKAMTIAALLCSLAKVDPEQYRRTPALLPTAERYRQFGVDARAALIRIIEAGAPGVLSPDDPPAVVDAWLRHQSESLTDPEARARAQAELQQISAASRRFAQPAVRAAQLPLDAGEQAYHALKIMDAFKAFWFHGDDGERIIRALIAMGRQVEAPDPRARDRYRDQLAEQARLVLVKLLRPNLGLAADAEEKARLKDSGRRFREDLAPMFTDGDEATREFILLALTYSGHVEPIATEKAVDALFGAALGDDPNAPADASGDASDEDQARARRARREYAITTLVILGDLADPDDYTPEEQAVGTTVIRRVEGMRDAVHERRGSRSQRSFLDTLDGLQESERADDDLRDRAGRFRRHGREIGERDADRALRDATARLRTAVSEGRGADVVDALRAEVERLNGRLARLRSQ